MLEAFVYSEDPVLSGEMVSLANGLGLSASVLALPSADAGALSGEGADRVIVLQGDSSRQEDYARPIADLIAERRPRVFLAGATVSGREIAARVAAILGCPLVNDIASLESSGDALLTNSMMYGGAVVLREQFEGFLVITVPAGKADVLVGEMGSGKKEIIEVEPDQRVARVGIDEVVYSGMDISVAKRLVCVGMGLGKEEDLSIAGELAAAAQAEICCTRPISEDREWLPSDVYIGLSGKVVQPDVIFEVGVSGQIQHTYGIRGTKTIVAINNNESALIFGACDYGVLGDLHETVPLLTQALSSL
jgi:electron transfer flavoprotein alpha subunit